MAVVPYKKQRRQKQSESWSAVDAIEKITTGAAAVHRAGSPLTGLGLGASRVVMAFSLVDDIKVEQIPRYRDQSTAEESAVYLLTQNIQPDFPQAAPTYPGIAAGNFMAGLPIYIGAGNTTARSISIWLFLDEACRMIIEDYNSLGRPVPYAYYAEDGSRDFPISIGGVAGAPTFAEKITPGHAEYQPTLVAPGAGPGAKPDSIFAVNQLTTNTLGFTQAPYAAHGPVLAAMEYDNMRYIYCDTGNYEGTFNSTVLSAPFTPIPGGTTSAQADGYTTGMIGVSTGSGNDPNLDPILTARLWAYNAGSPYVVLQRTWAPGLLGNVADRQLIVATVPHPDYYAWELAALQTVGNPGPQMNVRIWQVTASHLYRHLMTPQFDTRFLEMEANRAMGICCTVQNPTNEQYNGGLWLGYQSNLGEDWTEPAYSPGTASVYEFISQVNSNLKLTKDQPLLKNGAYFFPLPPGNASMLWKRPFNRIQIRQGAGQSEADALYKVNIRGSLSDRTWAMINLQAPLLNVGVQAQQINYRLAMCGEYKTRNPFALIRAPFESSEDWEDGFEMLGQLFQFYENPSHAGTIMKIIESIASKNPRFNDAVQLVKKWAPHVLKFGLPIVQALL